MLAGLVDLHIDEIDDVVPEFWLLEDNSILTLVETERPSWVPTEAWDESRQGSSNIYA